MPCTICTPRCGTLRYRRTRRARTATPWPSQTVGSPEEEKEEGAVKEGKTATVVMAEGRQGESQTPPPIGHYYQNDGVGLSLTLRERDPLEPSRCRRLLPRP